MRMQIASAEKLHIINGNGGKKFGGNNLITREDIAVILYRVMTLLGTETNTVNVTAFKDQDLISNYAKSAVSKLQQAGIILGKADGNYDPSGLASRVEATTMIYRLLVQQSSGQ